MKAKFAVFLIIAVAIGGTGGWIAARRANAPKSSGAAQTQRKILFYQSPMHPWIKSDKPGNCTICGMKLVPVYEGEKGFGDSGEDLVTLSSNSIQVINVQTDEVKKRPLLRTLRVAGIVDDDDTKHRRLSAYSEGRIDKLFVNFVGAEVQAGQPLAVFYSATLLTAESEYLTVLNQKALPGLSTNLQSERQRMIDSAAQRLKRLGYSDAQIDALAKKSQVDAQSEILSPMTGTVVTRNVYEGQYVKEGDVLFEIGDFSKMWFQFDAYERDLSWLKVGDMVDVTTPALPGRVFSAPIIFIDPNLNDMTRSAKVRVELDNPIVDEGARKRRLLYHKIYADGVVKVQAPEVLTVPRGAVLAASAQPLVYVDKGGGAYEQRKVKLGRSGDEFREVLDGLAEGERVVTTGNLLIDAQAQLNATSMSEEGPAAGPDATTRTGWTNSADVALTPDQQRATQEFLSVVSDLSAALAADSLDRFNERSPRAHADVPKLIDAIGNVKALRPALQKLEQSGHIEKAKDLIAARKEFLPFSTAVVELTKELRKQEPFKAIKIYNCPMVDRAFPGAPKSGQWIQLQPPLKNPFFGAEMIDCGTEVK